MLKENFLKKKLEAGIVVIGTWSVIPSAVVTDIIAGTGLDFVIIDLEHGPASFETAQNMTIACESHKVSPVVRVGGVIETEILRALDIGAHCIHVPNIENENDIEKLIKMIKYPPVGNRGFSPFTRAGGYSGINVAKLVKEANKNVLLAIHIEGVNAIDNLDSILKISEIDIVFIGLFDLSKSLGIPGDVNNPRVLQILKESVEKINIAGKYPGTIITNADQLKIFIGYGVKYVTYAVDCEVLSIGYGKINDEFNALCKG